MRTYLFSYGKLQPKYFPPDTLGKHYPDIVYGDLYDLGRDPAIADKKTENLVRGTLMEIDDSELPELDKDEYGFRRIRTRTLLSGHEAWVYVWDGKLPAKAKKIMHWPIDTAGVSK